MKNSKIGICEWVLPVQGPFSLVVASEIGYEGIQLGDLGGAGEEFPMNNKRIQQGYKDSSQKYGVELQSLHLYSLVRDGTMLYPIDTQQGKAAIRSIKSGIEACVKMNIPTLMLSSFFASQILNEYDFMNFASMLKTACVIGRNEGVQIVFESILHIDKILKMRKNVGEELKICYDILNPIRFGSGNPQEEIIRIGREAIDHIHLKDAPENLKGCCLLGKGRGSFFESVKTIKKIGFQGWFITENYYCQPPMSTGQDPLVLAKKDCETIYKTCIE